MLFNSLQFLVFFAVLFVVYFSTPQRFRPFLLLVASCYFYMAYIPSFILILFFIIFIDYFLGLKIAKSVGTQRKIYLLGSIFANLGTLFFFKYFNFFNENVSILANAIHWNYPLIVLQIALPLGLSFHVFQSLSYVIEVYKNRQQPEKSFYIYALYVMFFPQLVAGPIERPQHMLHQFHEVHLFDSARIRRGLEIIIWGFFKKLVIADKIAELVNHTYANVADSSGLMMLVSAVLFSYQLYCDFSGYSDIAVGLAMVFGYDLTQNFNRPYSAVSIADFWRRWHISLSSWLKDYLYYPLAFARKKISKWWLHFSLLITFVLIGLWHGANWTYVIFGALHGFYMVFSTLTADIRKKIGKMVGLATHPSINKAWQTVVVFVFATISFIFFRAPSVGVALDVLKKISSIFVNTTAWLGDWKHMFNPLSLGISPRQAIVIFGAIVLLEVVQYFQSKNKSPFIFESKGKIVRFGWYYALIFCILLLGHLGAQTFIYFKF